MKGGQSITCKGTALPTSGPSGISLPLHCSPTVCLDTEDSVTPGPFLTIDNKTFLQGCRRTRAQKVQYKA